MTARIVNLGAAHQNVQELLPWFVMGTLDEDDRVAVEQHVGTCTACRDEVAWHQQMRDANLAQPLTRDVDRAFAALRAQLPGVMRPTPRVNWLSAALEWWRMQQPWLRWSFALQPLAIAALAVALLTGVGASLPEQGTFHALSRPGGDAMARLVVVFSPQATQAEMRSALLANGAHIVDGPTAADAYVLAVAPERAEQALRQMRTERSVLLIQSLEAERTH
jgi:anti-sigma factor RsiW